MVCACIDIGSNTTRLLVADVQDGRLAALAQRRTFTRLGSEIRRDGQIGATKAAEVVAIVSEYLAEAHGLGARSPRVIGTAAMRAAANRDDVLDLLERATGVRPDVLDGEQEARLAFLGASKTLRDPPDTKIAVVDVGGGSSEVAVGTVADGMEWSVSLPIGSSALADTHCGCDPVSEHELVEMRAHAERVFDGLRAPEAEQAIAVGGSATSLCRLVGPVLDVQSMRVALAKLCEHSAAEVARRFDLDPQRVLLLPAGLVVLEAAAMRVGCPLRIGEGGVREGVCLQIAAI